ncbi:MAG: hypothetical protein Q8L15_06910 [Methylobacter sp.]|nr:hypothetical protein [Methylobacter sp.]
MKRWLYRNIVENILARFALFLMTKEGALTIFGFIYLLLSAASGSHHSIDPG